MKIYTIIGGVNGVGKSSFTGILKEQRSDLGILIDVNKITAELGGNALAGGKAALKKINECIEKGVSFTQETTLSGRRTAATAREVIEKGTVYGCTISAWTAQRKASCELPTGCAVAGMTFPRRTWYAALESVGRPWRRYSPTVTRRNSTTTTMASNWWRNTETASCVPLAAFAPTGSLSCSDTWISIYSEYTHRRIKSPLASNCHPLMSAAVFC